MSRFDLSAVFPSKDDPRHPPLWLWRALVWVGLAIFIGFFLYDSIGKLAELISVVLIAAFFGMALEPAVNFFARKGANKKIMTLVFIFSGLFIIIGAMYLFGNILFEQLTSLSRTIPDLYSSLQWWVNDTLHIEIPSAPDVLFQTLQNSLSDISNSAVGFSFGVFTVLIDVLAMLLIMYYMCSEGDRFRRAVASFLAPEKQRDFIRIFTITQVKIGSFLGSRLILAIISIFVVSIVGIVLDIPYWLPLAIFMGIVGQFVPTVGVYIGGGLPVLVALASKGFVDALIMLVVLVVYQNLENMLIMPKISQEALDLNPAVAFLSVLTFGYIWGPVGAFLALPVTATIVTVLKFALKRHDVGNIDDVVTAQTKELKTVKEEKRKVKK